MRVRVQPRPGKSFARGALQALQIALMILGVSSLSIFAWLQFERFYFEARYLKEFDRMAAVGRQTGAPPSLDFTPPALPMPFIPSPPDAGASRGFSSPNTEQTSTGGQNAAMPGHPGFDSALAGITALLPAARGNAVSVGGMRVLARLRVSRVGIEVAVLEGIEDRALRRGAGWIPGTARPGERGNVGIAAHRDTFFRPLREIRTGDRVEVETFDARQVYLVRSVSVVDPEFTAVLRPTGEPTVTLVTCFPFDYVGPAPRRYIVQARADGVALPATSAKVD
jgi:LPXTG-site transpeptidase (sortase) family protein